MKKSIISLFTATLLFAAPSAQEVANQLKTLDGKTLKNPVIFVKYGKGAFDWLAVTTDGKYAAKLNGLNPNGTFNYTILGDPAKYGLKLNVSLLGVEIKTTSTNSESSSNLQKKIIMGETAFAAFSWRLSNSNSFSFRDNRPLFFSKLFPSLLIPKNYTRTTLNLSSEICIGGGSAIMTGNSPTDYNIIFNNCKTGKDNPNSVLNSIITYNGREHITKISEDERKVEFYNFTLLYSGKTSQLSSFIEYGFINSNSKENSEIQSFNNLYTTYKIQNKKIFEIIYDNYYNYEINNQYTSTISGKIKVECQKGWTEFVTLSPIQGFSSDDCPDKGVLKINNDNILVYLKINNDTSIDIVDPTTNKILKHYNNCLEIPSPFNICKNSQ